MESNKVTVKILGQSYTIAGEKSPEEIEKIAAYVDEKMQMVSKLLQDGTPGKTAVLSAINIAEEYFDALGKIEILKSAKEQVEKDSQHYLEMWEDAKKSFVAYKDNAMKAQEQKKGSDAKLRELQEKCSELENSFFDIQMENIQLKDEVDKLKKELQKSDDMFSF